MASNCALGHLLVGFRPVVAAVCLYPYVDETLTRYVMILWPEARVQTTLQKWQLTEFEILSLIAALNFWSEKLMELF